MEINNYTIKLTGEADLLSGLENGKDYLLSVEGSTVSETAVDNHDGSKDIVWKFKPLKVEVLKDRGETIKSIDRKSNAQKFRSLINMSRKQEFPEIDEEEFYNRFMGKAMANWYDLWEFLKKIPNQ